MKRHNEVPNEAGGPPPAATFAGERSIDRSTLELLQNWRRQDATDDVQEVLAAEREVAEFKKAMNETRTLSGEPLLYS